MCSIKQNVKLVWKFVRKSYVLKPLVVILLVIICPGVSSPMFYFYTTKLNMTSDQMGIKNVLISIGEILG